MKTYITNARVVLLDQVLENAALVIEDEFITAINPLNPCVDRTLDLDGALLMPGLIDLHCDQIEKLIEPRAGVHFDFSFALAESDRRNASCGITTTFQSVSFAHAELGVRNDAMAKKIVESVHAFRSTALIDHRVHCRYEITDPYGLQYLLDLLDRKQMDLISLMDHTPGRRQYRDSRSYEVYLENAYRISTDQARELIRAKQENSSGALDRVEQLIAKAHTMRVPIASHDDDSKEHVDFLSRHGGAISEFPVTLEAAAAAHAAGLKTVFGSPNVLRGKSQGGGIRAIDAIQQDVVDCLCSDYYPATLLAALILIPRVSNWELSRAVRLATANPAEAAGLHDRGEIAVGKRADVIAVTMIGESPHVSRVWVAGQLAYHAEFHHRKGNASEYPSNQRATITSDGEDWDSTSSLANVPIARYEAKPQ
jgi:alpha-D-ribose 1-methylphosphonate 5-triphosphate diphosphatase